MIKIVTTTPELAAITREIGGNLVSIETLAKPDSNYHTIEAKPTDVSKVARADVFVRVGMDLDMWADALLNTARNPKVNRSATGYVDASVRVRKRGVTTDTINGASGDVHPMGNPHYWLDPKDAVVMSYEILLALRSADPTNAKTYDANYSRFSTEINGKLTGWLSALAPYKGKGFITYHDEWVYFAERYGLNSFGFMEPKPGFPPSGAHINTLIQQMKAKNVKAIILSSVYSSRYADLIAKEIGSKVVRVPYSVGSMGTNTYDDYMEKIVRSFAEALR
jgi:zinc/manganese transport system substrate-binding protein